MFCTKVSVIQNIARVRYSKNTLMPVGSVANRDADFTNIKQGGFNKNFMFKSLFKKLGFGNAKVDARLRGSAVVQGGVLEGDVFITGADEATTIDELYLRVVTEYTRESD